MLLNMDDQLKLTKRDVKQIQHELASFNMKINETNAKLDREAKLKDQLDIVKTKIGGIEKGMAADIETAVKNHDEMEFKVRKVDQKI